MLQMHFSVVAMVDGMHVQCNLNSRIEDLTFLPLFCNSRDINKILKTLPSKNLKNDSENHCVKIILDTSFRRKTEKENTVDYRSNINLNLPFVCEEPYSTECENLLITTIDGRISAL
ncbi:hypothetical protein CEXT_574631 [Caerostris extrusa]|uniref:Uncharacterized protein n=1 Tax=Caerostris extrusa TaxID=172846 RepID=A0AAV4P4G0_CAEEX|nr:hypothetical protein CEXT_574631 [Caerostris extrusa]